MSVQSSNKNFGLLFFTFTFLIYISANAQFNANAGVNVTLCPGSSTTIGGSPSASGGLAPYTYSWSPTTGLSNPNIANPIATPPYDINYVLTVTDDTNAVTNDVMNITYSYIKYVNAGADTSICESSYALIGGTLNVTGQGVTYSWNPSTFLDNASLPRPTSSPLSSITYTLTSTIAGCPAQTDVINVTVIPTPKINAGNDTTIKLGERAILNGSGGFSYAWSPISSLMYYYTAHPNAEPLVTTTYILYGTDQTKKCAAIDSVTVFVEPSTDVVFYNTFTPNGDGNNDTWYIGNIEKYPENRLEIYNRYGKIVFKTSAYLNTWDGNAFGEELPKATYFYVMDLGNGMGVFHGTVTIIK